ncbi:unnamed protein product [Eruca vesicaria subsp. sativa]|uniref:Uncharacterized protein n=1 Tax=Eruca vesicaria subsp. sativa TaxID=29727 RepID=A0ABC8J861_ERUVS|nr:unnamed protein product [Eruca vesicaria subsp. sativa]
MTENIMLSYDLMVIGKKLEQFLEDVCMVRVSSSSTLRGSLRKILRMEYTRCAFRMLRHQIEFE